MDIFIYKIKFFYTHNFLLPNIHHIPFVNMGKDMSHLFTTGPLKCFPETLLISGKQLPYSRNDEFSQIVPSACEGLKRLLFTKNREIILLTRSGTEAMETTVMN